MSNVCAILIICLILIIPVLMITLLIRFLLKKSCRKLVIAIACCVGAIIPLTILGALTDPATWCEHEYSIIEEIVPTCVEEGNIVKKCSLCEKEEVEIIDKLPHKWINDQVVEPTCTSDGYTNVKCEICSLTGKIDIVNAIGHSLKEVSRIEPTKDTDGEVVRKCNQCGYEEIEIIPKEDTPPNDDNFISGDFNEVIGGELPTIESDNLVNELIEIGFTIEEATKYREIFLKCGIESIEGAKPTSPTATIDDLVAYRIVMDDKRTMWFTIDKRELFYIALNGTDVYDTSKGGFLISIDDVHIPESEITESVKTELELRTQLLLEPYFVKALWFSSFAFGRSDDNYVVRCEVYAENRMGFKNTVMAFVYYEDNGTEFVVTAISIDGVRYK